MALTKVTSGLMKPDNNLELEYTSQLGTTSVVGAATGYVVRTNYYDANVTAGSGATFKFTGVTTLGKAGNVPDADGYFYDADGKQFAVVGSPVNVLWFGAVGDGVVNDGPAIRSACNALSPNGGVVELPKGTFQVVEQISITSNNLSIVGSGDASVIRKDAAGSTTAIFVLSGTGGTISGFKLSAVRIVNAKVATSTTALINCDGPSVAGYEISDCSFSNPVGAMNNIFIKVQVAKTVEHVKILRNRFESSGRMNFEIINHDQPGVYAASDIIVEENYIGSAAFGVSLSGEMERLRVANNIFENCGYGLELVGTRDIVVNANVFSGAFASGVISASGSRVMTNLVLSNNTTNNFAAGRVFLGNTPAALITGNILYLTQRVILSTGSTGCVLRSNIIKSTSGQVLEMDSSGKHDIQGNVFDNSTSGTNLSVVRAYNALATDIVLIGNTLKKGTGGVYYDELLGGNFDYVERNILNTTMQDSLNPGESSRYYVRRTASGVDTTATFTVNSTVSWSTFIIKIHLIIGLNGGNFRSYVHSVVAGSGQGTTTPSATLYNIVTHPDITLAVTTSPQTVVVTATYINSAYIHNWDIEVVGVSASHIGPVVIAA